MRHLKMPSRFLRHARDIIRMLRHRSPWQSNPAILIGTSGKNRLITAACVFLVSLSFCCKPKAEGKLSRSKLDTLVELYIKRAFGNDSSDRLRKFETVTALPISFECLSGANAVCASSLFTLNEAYRVSNRLNVVESPQPAIRFVLAKDSQLAEQSEALGTEFNGGFSDTSEPRCVLYYALKGERISKAAILVSTDQGFLLQKICAAVQFGQALGISSPANLNFSDLWSEEPNGYQHMDEAQFAMFRQTNSLLQYIHMCPLLHSGMTKQMVIETLKSSNVCTNGIEVN